jgi:hypothetical protein
MIKKLIIIEFITSLIFICQFTSGDHLESNVNVSDTNEITDVPVNIYQVNSEYDDYNSYVGNSWSTCDKLIFSSNRFSKGENFDLISYDFCMYIDNSKPNISKVTYSAKPDSFYNKILPGVNTKCNELGPYLYKFNYRDGSYFPQYDSLLFFVNRDCNGKSQIFYNKFYYNSSHTDLRSISDFKQLNIFNSKFDIGYISATPDFGKLFFSSNKDGNYDLYEVSDSSGLTIFNEFNNYLNLKITKLDELNSKGDDKCPFVDRDVMVFTSNREGGYGGFDLYYSKLINGKWSAPRNLGSKINSKYDEYRPIIFNNNFMIFSSNRPGGKGGFDLYIVDLYKNWP